MNWLLYIGIWFCLAYIAAMFVMVGKVDLNRITDRDVKLTLFIWLGCLSPLWVWFCLKFLGRGIWIQNFLELVKHR